jgi:hypothetical protein
MYYIATLRSYAWSALYGHKVGLRVQPYSDNLIFSGKAAMVVA